MLNLGLAYLARWLKRNAGPTPDKITHTKTHTNSALTSAGFFMKITDNQIAKTKTSLRDIKANSFGFYQKADKEK